MAKRRYLRVLAVMMVVVMFISLLPPMGSVYAAESAVSNEVEDLDDDDNLNVEEMGESTPPLPSSVQEENLGSVLDHTVEASSIKTFAEGTFLGGTGSMADPYIVVNANQLNMIREEPNAVYKLGADIDLSVIENWEPIEQFLGVLDGNNFVITNLRIHLPDSDNVGLISDNRGEIKNLGLKNVYITGNNYVGSLVGYNRNGKITKSYATGLVIGNNRVGGLAGQNNEIIEKSFSSCTVVGNEKVGSLIGYSSYGELFNSYADGFVSGEKEVGGLAGNHINSSSAKDGITNSYSASFVHGKEYTYSGGLIGDTLRAKVTRSFWDIEASGISRSAGGGTGKSTDEMKRQATYSGWDFTNVWEIDEGKSYPKLIGVGDTESDEENPPTHPEITTMVNKSLVASSEHSFALKSDGTVASWGRNWYGRLGDGTSTTRYNPVAVQDLDDALEISSKGVHTLALKADGTVVAWGQNTFGNLGDGSSTDRHTPVPVRELTDVLAIAAGGDGGLGAHSLALKSDGTVFSWGYNDGGRLGDGTRNNRYTPVQVQGLIDVVAISAGNTHSLALKENGTVVEWGSTPIEVRNLTDVVAISAGSGYSLALKKDGTVVSWGTNLYGRLGDGTTVARHTPVPVYGLTDVVAISAGSTHSLALKSDGTAVAWGRNNYGDLGDGTTTDRYTPVPVQGLNDVVAVSAGIDHSLALKSDGTVVSWGRNSYGRLGDGTTTDSHTPVKVQDLDNVRIPDEQGGISPNPDPTTPIDPTELKVVGQTTAEIQLEWDEVENATEYVLERRVKPTVLNNVAYFFQRMSSVITKSDFDDGYEEAYRGTDTTFTDTSVARGTWYDYRVKAVNQAGESDFSSVEACTYQLVTYNWFPLHDEDGNEATEYIVQRNGEEIGRTTETRFTDNKAVPGELNLYRVVPVFEDSEGKPIEIELDRITIAPSTVKLNVGEAKKLKVTAFYSDGSRLDITDETVFNTSDDGIAAVNTSGIVSAHAAGTATISANYNGEEIEATVNVVEEPVVVLKKLNLSPATVEMYPDETQSLTATARYNDNSSRNVNNDVDYYSSNPAVATVDETGDVIAHAVGAATVTATYEGETAIATISVIPVPELTGITVSPDIVNIHPEHSRQLYVSAQYSDNNSRAVTANATFESSDKTVAIVNSSGLVTALAEGQATITATYEGETATAEINVVPQPDLELMSISIEPAQLNLRPDHMRSLKVMANYSDNSKKDVTGEANFTSGGAAIASVSENGNVTAYTEGTTYITAEYEDKTSNTSVTVKEIEEVTLTGLRLSPSTVNLYTDQMRQLTSTAVFSDNSTRLVTSGTVFTSSDETVAKVDSKGIVTAIGVGTALMTAEYKGKTSEVQVIVSGAVLENITVSPETIELEPEETRQLTVRAKYSNNGTETVTAQATYSSSDETVATVDNNGKVTAIGAGSSVITVEYNGKIAKAQVAVSNVVLQSLTISPVTVKLEPNKLRQLTVRANYSNKSTKIVTDEATYQSSDETVATVDENGTVTGIAEGNAKITAEYEGKTATSEVSVKETELTGITVTPSTVTMSPDAIQELIVYAKYNNRSSKNVTPAASFTSSDESVVFAGENGLLAALKPGTATVTVEYQGIQAISSVTVNNIPVPTQGPDFIEIAWYEVPGAAHYELLRDGQVIYTVEHDDGQMIYRYKDQPIDPNQAHAYEIVPYQEDGSKGDDIDFVSLPQPTFTSMVDLEGQKLGDLSAYPNGSVIMKPEVENPFVQHVDFYDTQKYINEYNAGDGWLEYHDQVDIQENGAVYARTRDPETESVSPSSYYVFDNIKSANDPFTESPSLRVVTTTADSVTLEGMKIDRATEYILERRYKNGEFIEVSRKSGGDDLVFTDSDLEEKTTYRYRLVATNGTVESQSLTASATTKALPAEAPDWVEATLIDEEPNGLLYILPSLLNAGHKEIKVVWSEAKVEPQRYILYRQVNDGDVVQIATIDPTEELLYVDTNISKDTSYTYYVASLKDGDMSTKTKSNTVYVPKEDTGWIGEGENPDDYTGEFIWVTQAGDKAKVEWLPALGSPERYFLYRVDISNPLLRKTIGVLSGDTLEFMDDSVMAGNTYVYYIQAQYRDGIRNHFSDEFASDEFSLALDPDPNKIYTPKNVTTRIDGNTVKLTWDIDYDAEHFFLYRKAGNDILVRFIGKLDGNLREYVDHNVKEGVEYQYFLEAVYPKGKSDRIESNKVTM